MLFPLADGILDAGDKDRLAGGFERVEVEETGAGVHERYHAMAHEL